MVAGAVDAPARPTHGETPSPVDAILVVHDGGRWVGATWAAVAAQTVPVRRLVVVDTGSTDDSLAVIERLRTDPASGPGGPHAVTITTMARSTGYAAAVAEGLALLAGTRTDETRIDGTPTDDTRPAEAPADAPTDTTESWVWLLQDDCVPTPTVLERLLDVAATSPAHPAILGPKYVVADDPSRLVEVGQRVSRTGRRGGAPQHGELDQGQYDGRTEVLAVGTGAALVRADVLRDLHGLEQALPGATDLDLCWRARLAGHQVVVVPEAVALDHRATATGVRGLADTAHQGSSTRALLDSGTSLRTIARERREWDRTRRQRARRAHRAERRATRLVALTRAPWWAAPFLTLWIVLASIVAALGMLVVKRPRTALAEIGDLGALLHPLGSLRARWRARRDVVPGGRAAVAALFVSSGTALRAVADELYEGLPHRPGLGRRDRDPLREPVEPGPVPEESVDLVGPSGSAARHPGVLATLAALVIALIAWRPLLLAHPVDLFTHGVSGGELAGLHSNAGTLLQWMRQAFDPSGLGRPGEAPAWAPVVAAGSWLVGLLPSAAGGSASGVAIGLALLLAMPAAALSAYLAGRVLTPRPWPRALVAVLWALLPVLTQGLAEGRVGIVAPHVLLPLIVAGLVRIAQGSEPDAEHGAEQGGPSWTVVAATTLAVAVAGAFAPLLLVLTTLVGLALLVRGPGRARLAGLVLAVGPLAALGPAVLRWWHTPALLLTGPGLTQWGGESATARPWQLALLWPSSPSTWSDSTPVPGPVGTWLPMVLPLLTVPVVAGGVLALVRGGRVSPRLWTLAGLTTTGLVLALVAPRVTIGRAYLDPRPGHTDTLANLTSWPGVPLDLAAIGLLGALLVVLGTGSAGLAEGRWRRGLRVGATGLATGGLVLCAVALALVLGFRTMGVTITTAGDSVPQAARDQLSSSLANRYLAVEVRGGRLGYELWSDSSGTLARELPTGEAPPAVETAALDRALASGTASTAGADAAAALADLGVGFVGVTSATDAPVITRLDTTAALSRAAGDGEVNLWRVLPRTSPTHGEAVPSSRLRLVDASGVPLAMVPVSGPGLGVDTDVDAADATSGARLMAAQDPRWSAVVRVSADGRTITASPGTGYPSYPLPDGTRHLQVQPLVAHSWWWWATIGWVVLLGLLALPFGTRGRRPVDPVARERIS